MNSMICRVHLSQFRLGSVSEVCQSAAGGAVWGKTPSASTGNPRGILNRRADGDAVGLDYVGIGRQFGARVDGEREAVVAGMKDELR